MLEALVVSQVILWIVVIALSAVVMALVRQIGVLHERIAPMGALTIDHGPKIGEVAPVFELGVVGGGGKIRVGAADANGKGTLLMFVSPTCPVCKKMIPIVKSLAKESEKFVPVFASDGEEPEQERFARENNLAPYPLVLSRELGTTYQVAKLPYAVLIDANGIVRAKGLVNTREHLESLIQAEEFGVASLQDYLKDRVASEKMAAGNGQRKHHGQIR
ncbi:MAG TPA: methylamine dehydrogenase accessory protein MauD [Candidatus Binataceae bacterium]|nr:methylamine dehydrogenase accessory protein MauD [Candidatus Binataceae bacterium]